MDSRFFDMLHHARDDHVLAVRDRIHVDLHGVFQKPVDEHGPLGGGADGVTHISREFFRIVHERHGAPAEHVARTHENGIADGARDLERILGVRGRARWRLGEMELLEHVAEAVPILGQIDALGRGSQNRRAGLFERLGELERRLAAELHDDALWIFAVNDFEHVLEREGFEIEPVARIVVRAHRLGVAVHHDGLETRFRQRHHGVHAAIVELDALADAVGAAAQDDDFLARSRRRLVFLLVGRVEIRRMGLEFRSAGIHLLVDGPDAEAVSRSAHRSLVRALSSGDVQVAEAVLLQKPESERIIEQIGRCGVFFHLHEFGQMRQKPRVDPRRAVNLLFRPILPCTRGRRSIDDRGRVSSNSLKSAPCAHRRITLRALRAWGPPSRSGRSRASGRLS